MDSGSATVELDELERAVDAALDRSTIGLSAHEFADALVDLQSIGTKMQTLIALTTADAARAGVAADDGVRTVAMSLRKPTPTRPTSGPT